MTALDPELEALFQERLRVLKNLQVEIYRDVHFHPETMVPGAVESILCESSGSLESVEKLVNYIEIYNWFHGMEDMKRLETMANEIAEAWEEKLEMLNPRYRVSRFGDENGPGITFHLDRQLPLLRSLE